MESSRPSHTPAAVRAMAASKAIPMRVRRLMTKVCSWPTVASRPASAKGRERTSAAAQRPSLRIERISLALMPARAGAGCGLERIG
jgi:hypothetical protein